MAKRTNPERHVRVLGIGDDKRIARSRVFPVGSQLGIERFHMALGQVLGSALETIQDFVGDGLDHSLSLGIGRRAAVTTLRRDSAGHAGTPLVVVA